jgi:hypothetical protein
MEDEGKGCKLGWGGVDVTVASIDANPFLEKEEFLDADEQIDSIGSPAVRLGSERKASRRQPERRQTGASLVAVNVWISVSCTNEKCCGAPFFSFAGIKLCRRCRPRRAEKRDGADGDDNAGGGTGEWPRSCSGCDQQHAK